MKRTITPYEGKEPYIFASYSEKDKEHVLPLLEALAGKGYRIWWDEGIAAGEAWTDVIASRLLQCAAFLVFHSAASAESGYCISEIRMALHEEKPILSVYLEQDVPLLSGLAMYLSMYQGLSLRPDKTPEDFAREVERASVLAACREDPWVRRGSMQWRLDGSGLLTIGTNENSPLKAAHMPDYEQNWDSDGKVCGSTAPWMEDADRITSVRVKPDIQGIGAYAFFDCVNLISAAIPDSVASIGTCAFGGCASLRHITIPEGAAVSKDAFDAGTTVLRSSAGQNG